MNLAKHEFNIYICAQQQKIEGEIFCPPFPSRKTHFSNSHVFLKVWVSCRDEDDSGSFKSNFDYTQFFASNAEFRTLNYDVTPLCTLCILRGKCTFIIFLMCIDTFNSFKKFSKFFFIF